MKALVWFCVVAVAVYCFLFPYLTQHDYLFAGKSFTTWFTLGGVSWSYAFVLSFLAGLGVAYKFGR